MFGLVGRNSSFFFWRPFSSDIIQQRSGAHGPPPSPWDPRAQQMLAICETNVNLKISSIRPLVLPFYGKQTTTKGSVQNLHWCCSSIFHFLEGQDLKLDLGHESGFHDSYGCKTIGNFNASPKRNHWKHSQTPNIWKIKKSSLIIDVPVWDCMSNPASITRLERGWRRRRTAEKRCHSIARCLQEGVNLLCKHYGRSGIEKWPTKETFQIDDHAMQGFTEFRMRTVWST